jgi:hypothetical protein
LRLGLLSIRLVGRLAGINFRARRDLTIAI